MRYGALIGWGVVIYALMYLVWSGFVLYGFVGGFLPRLVGLILLISVTAIATRALRVHSWRDVLPYSIAWMIVVALCDAIFTMPYSGWALYANWNVWVGYLLVACVPLVVASSHFTRGDRV
ncbi:hypothetical protein HY970_04000 [Candidatus Kaiserbacteria bacterium]|nr:hypothetical protein [Candidatus Kaiserbacteria bacterium]